MVTKNLKIITTSWDDGHPLDLKLITILNKFSIPATFYIPHTNNENEVIDEKELKKISFDYDIGNHTLNHLRLNKISNKESYYQVSKGKDWLENLLGKEILTFCYPGGKYNSDTKDIVKSCGIKYARTVELFNTFLNDAITAPTTMQLKSINLFPVTKNLVKRKKIKTTADFILRHRLQSDPVYWADYFLNKVSEEGGIFHLWGHSWEIEKYDMWGTLEKILKLLSNKNEFILCNNLELLNYVE